MGRNGAIYGPSMALMVRWLRVMEVVVYGLG